MYNSRVNINNETFKFDFKINVEFSDMIAC